MKATSGHAVAVALLASCCALVSVSATNTVAGPVVPDLGVLNLLSVGDWGALSLDVEPFGSFRTGRRAAVWIGPQSGEMPLEEAWDWWRLRAGQGRGLGPTLDVYATGIRLTIGPTEPAAYRARAMSVREALRKQIESTLSRTGWSLSKTGEHVVNGDLPSGVPLPTTLPGWLARRPGPPPVWPTPEPAWPTSALSPGSVVVSGRPFCAGLASRPTTVCVEGLALVPGTPYSVLTGFHPLPSVIKASQGLPWQDPDP
jgi:hypothetical protein